MESEQWIIQVIKPIAVYDCSDQLYQFSNRSGQKVKTRVIPYISVHMS